MVGGHYNSTPPLCFFSWTFFSSACSFYWFLEDHLSLENVFYEQNFTFIFFRRCDHCGKIFALSLSLRMHIREHSSTPSPTSTNPNQTFKVCSLYLIVIYENFLVWVLFGLGIFRGSLLKRSSQMVRQKAIANLLFDFPTHWKNVASDTPLSVLPV